MMGRLPRWLLVLIVILLVWPGIGSLWAADGSDSAVQDAAAEHPENLKPGPFWSESGDFGATFNPRGLELSAGIAYQDPYRYDRIRNEANASWEAGAATIITPSYVQPSLYFEWMPAPFATGRLEYDPYYYFGRYSGSLSFASAQDHFGDPELRARSGTEESGAGSRVLFQPTFQMSVAGIVFRNQSDLARYRFPGIGPYFLVQEYDTLLEENGRLFANRTQVLKEILSSDGALLIGPYYEFVRGAPGTRIRRQIGILLYSEKRKGTGHERHIVAQAGYDLTDQNREGQVFLLIGFGFSSGAK